MLMDERLTDELISAWWRLRQLPGFGTVTTNDILNQLGSPHALLRCNPQELRSLGLRDAAIERWQNDQGLSNGLETLLNWRRQRGNGVLMVATKDYPEALANLRDAPTFLYYSGTIQALQRPMIAMVGSRHPTPYGRQWARECAAELAASGMTIVSGLALGIDGEAHEGAVRCGSTIAVMGSGPDQVYPARHLGLAQRICDQGMLLSEFAPGVTPQARHFPSRNRIISGMTLATIVVEADIKSGTMITARLAAEQGRDVFALPGVVSNPLSRGPHQLIREGAALIENANDVLGELGLDIPVRQPDIEQQSLDLASSLLDNNKALPAKPPAPTTSVNIAHKNHSAVEAPELVTCIDYTTTSIDLIAIRANLDMAHLLPELLQLELDGWLQQHPGGYARIK
jgi:DNA processing protein